MNLAKTAAILALPLCLNGCQAMIWGQLTALFASVLIFAGTLALGRATEVRAENLRKGGSPTTLH